MTEFKSSIIKKSIYHCKEIIHLPAHLLIGPQMDLITSDFTNLICICITHLEPVNLNMKLNLRLI